MQKTGPEDMTNKNKSLSSTNIWNFAVCNELGTFLDSKCWQSFVIFVKPEHNFTL